MPRRSISQSLSAREIEFIKAPLVEAKKETSAVKSPKANKSTEKTTPVTEPNTSEPQPEKKPQPVRQPTNSQQPWVTITTRLPSPLHAQLRRAAFERAERGEVPNTIQDILATAAEAWLDKNEPSTKQNSKA